jgi:copper homeostasis protein
MGCGALNAESMAVATASGLRELHFAALRQESSGMQYRNTEVGMGGNPPPDEYTLTVTDEAEVAELIRIAQQASAA